MRSLDHLHLQKRCSLHQCPNRSADLVLHHDDPGEVFPPNTGDPDPIYGLSCPIPRSLGASRTAGSHTHRLYGLRACDLGEAIGDAYNDLCASYPEIFVLVCTCCTSLHPSAGAATRRSFSDMNVKTWKPLEIAFGRPCGASTANLLQRKDAARVEDHGRKRAMP